MKSGSVIKIIALALAAVTLFLFVGMDDSGCGKQRNCDFCGLKYDPDNENLHGLNICGEQAPCGLDKHYVSYYHMLQSEEAERAQRRAKALAKHSECTICGGWLCDGAEHGEGVCTPAEPSNDGGGLPEATPEATPEVDGANEPSSSTSGGSNKNESSSKADSSQKSSDAALKSLTVVDEAGNELELSPEFSSDVLTYEINARYTLAEGSKVTVSGEASNPKATVSGGGILTLKAVSNARSAELCKLTVAAEDGITQKTYTLKIKCIRSPNGDTTLRVFKLTLPDGSEIDMRNADARKQISLSNVTSAVVTAVPSNDAATVSGNVGEITIAPGKNSFIVRCRAKDDSSASYVFKITMSETSPPAESEPSLSSVATLSALSAGTVTLSPAFSPDVYEYSGDVGTGGVSSVTITAAPTDPNATVAGTGDYTLQAGYNTITLTVTAQDGVTQKQYKVYIKAPSLSDNALLSSLTIVDAHNNGTVIDLDPAFSPDVFAYGGEANLEDIQAVSVTAAPADPNATVAGNSAYNLISGANEITVTVTAQDGVTKQSYTVIIDAYAAP